MALDLSRSWTAAPGGTPPPGTPGLGPARTRHSEPLGGTDGGLTTLNEGIRVHEAPACLFCEVPGRMLYSDQRDQLYAAPGRWGVRACDRCGHLWLDPRPESADIPKLYSAYHTHDAPAAGSRLRPLWLAVEQSMLAGAFGYRELGSGPTNCAAGQLLARIGLLRGRVEGDVMTLRGERRGRLLDVGSGNGALLARMRSLGWDASGTEPDPRAAENARRQFDLPVHEGLLADLRLPPASYDAITMSHVLEHSEEPVALLREAGRLLRPGGQVVVATPNAGGLGHRLFRDAWRSLEVPRHLHVFTRKSLALCAERAGMPVLSLTSTARSASWICDQSAALRRHRPAALSHPGAATLLTGSLFQAAEHAGLALDSGEELLLVLGAPR